MREDLNGSGLFPETRLALLIYSIDLRQRLGYRVARRDPSRLQGTVEERKTPIHTIVDPRMRVGKFLVAVLDARLRQTLRQDASPVMNLILILPAAVDVDTS